MAEGEGGGTGGTKTRIRVAEVKDNQRQVATHRLVFVH